MATLEELLGGGDHAEHADDHMDIMESRRDLRRLLFSKKVDERKQFEERLQAMVSAMEAKYNANLRADTGSIIECPVCSKKFKKATYHKVFCSNQKTHGAENCKDRYWNTVDEKRRNRAKEWAPGKGLIIP